MTGNRCAETHTSRPSYRGVRLIESLDTVKRLETGVQRSTPVVRLRTLREVSVKREFTAPQRKIAGRTIYPLSFDSLLFP